MVLTEEAAFAIMVVLAVFVVVLVALAVGGVVFAARGKRVLGAILVAAVAAFVFAPALIDQIRIMPVRADLEARANIPDALDLTGQRVLFITSGSTICDGICGDVLGIGTQLEAYWTGAGGMIEQGPDDHPLLGVLGREQDVVRVALGAPVQDLGGQRYAEQIATGGAPPYDVVIFQDESGLLSFAAPDLLGDPLSDGPNTQFATLVFTDWPDPFAGPPPAPAYRSVSAWIDTRPVLWWPFRQTTESVPSVVELGEAWDRAICAGAGDADARDDVTYGYVCADPEGGGTQ